MANDRYLGRDIKRGIIALVVLGVIAAVFYEERGFGSKPAPSTTTTAPAKPLRPVPDDFWIYEKRVHDMAIPRVFNVGPSKNDWTADDITRWNRENPEKAKAFRDRRWRAEFATLVLYERDCAPGKFDSVRDKMFGKWNALPEAERTEALNYEIERRKEDFPDMSGFCAIGGGLGRYGGMIPNNPYPDPSVFPR